MKKIRLPVLLLVPPLLLSPAEVTAEDDAVRHMSPMHLLTPCFAGAVGCAQTVTGRISEQSCFASDNVYSVRYEFNGTAGQRLTLSSASPSFRMGISLVDGRTGNNTVYATTRAPATAMSAEIRFFQLPYTGPYRILLSPSVPGTFGDYVLTVNCGSFIPPGGTCTASPTALCLNNNRFRVTANFLAPQGQSGDATAVPRTSDTGLFYFFSANNIEAILKVVDGCSLNSRYWVFAGGLTNVQVALTVLDTQSGTSRTYTNPQGTAFQPIQDTAAFATCP